MQKQWRALEDTDDNLACLHLEVSPYEKLQKSQCCQIFKYNLSSDTSTENLWKAAK